MVRHRLLALATAVLLAIPVFAVSVTLAPVAPVAADGGVCQLNNGTDWAGDWKDPNFNVDGVSAVIYTPHSQYYYPCTYAQGNDGPSTWVALVPGNTSIYFGDPYKIIQFGMLRCNDYLYPPGNICTHDANGAPELHYFYATGGCNLTLPGVTNLGVAVLGSQHTFQISHNTSTGGDRYNFWLDGVNVHHIFDNEFGIDCWANPDGSNYAGLQADWEVEKKDYGDSAGTGAVDEVVMNSALYRKTSTQVWQGPVWPSDPYGSVNCGINTRPTGTGHYTCKHYFNNSLDVWTTF